MDGSESDSPVRTAAVLHLDSPRTSSGCAQDELYVDLDVYRVAYENYCLPGLDGFKICEDILLDSAESLTHDSSAGETLAAPKGSLRHVPPHLREEALRRAVEKMFEGASCPLAASELTSSPPQTTTESRGQPSAREPSALDLNVWYSILPKGPPAVVVMSNSQPPPDTPPKKKPRKRRSSSSEELGSDEDSDEGSKSSDPPGSQLPPAPAFPFPPTWLTFVYPSLVFLDLSFSRNLDPAKWDLSVLAAMPRLTFLGLRSTELVSELPNDLPVQLPALRVLDLDKARFKLSPQTVSLMVVAISSQVPSYLVGLDPNTPRRQLVITGMHLVPPRSSKVKKYVWKPKKPGDKKKDKGKKKGKDYDDDDDDEIFAPSARSEKDKACTLTLQFDDNALELEGGEEDDGGAARGGRPRAPRWHTLTSAPAVRAVREANERAFLSYARDLWWHVRRGSETSLLHQPMDFSMVRLLYDLGVLLLPPEDTDLELDMNEELGDELYLRTEAPWTGLSLDWPYDSPRLDSPTWSHEQEMHSHFYGSCMVYPSLRQWRLLVDDWAGGGWGMAPPPPPPSSGGLYGSGLPHAGLGDPFEVEVVAFHTLEQRERFKAGPLYSSITANVMGLVGCGVTYNREAAMRTSATNPASRPDPTCPVVVPTPAALASRTMARRMLLAGLLGCGVEKLSPAVPGTVSVTILLLAVRLEGRLFGRIRRVSILPVGHSAYATTHAARYWASVKSLQDALAGDTRFRAAVVMGALPLSTVAEMPVPELKALLTRLDRAARKGEAGQSRGEALAELATAAADAADLEALQRQLSAGGRLDRPVPVFPEDWIPAEQKVDSLCSWHIADPRVWPHGTVLHNAVARGHLRTATWLLDHGLSVNCRISVWDFTPVHLCCVRPAVWQHDNKFITLSLWRIPVRPGKATPAADRSTAGSKGGPAAGSSRLTRKVKRAPGQVDSDASEDDARDDPLAASNATVLDRKLGLPPDGVFMRPSEMPFQGICKYRVRKLRALRQFMCSPWKGADDPVDWKNSLNFSKPGNQQLQFQTLPCTAPLASNAAQAHDVTHVSSAALAAAAPPILRLLLARGDVDLAARSWSGLLPVHYAAGTAPMETLLALAEAGASLRAPLPGTLVGPLHMVAYRSSKRVSGLTPRAAIRALICQPLVSVGEVMGCKDEWRNVPLSYLIRSEKHLPVDAFESLLGVLRAGLGGKAPSGDMVEGAARALVYGIVYQMVDHVRVLLAHFPEAVAVALPPMAITPLHVAALMIMWREADTMVWMSILGDMHRKFSTRVCKGLSMDQCEPYAPPAAMLPPSMVGAPGAATSGGPFRAGSSRGGGSGAGDKSVLVLGADKEEEAASGEAGGDTSGDESDVWDWWPYNLIMCGPSPRVEDNESEMMAMQRTVEAQLKVVELLLAAGAPVNAQDAAGVTPLVIATLGGTAPMVVALLAKGADAKAATKLLNAQHEHRTQTRFEALRTRRNLCLGLDYCMLLPPGQQPEHPEAGGSRGAGSRVRHVDFDDDPELARLRRALDTTDEEDEGGGEESDESTQSGSDEGDAGNMELWFAPGDDMLFGKPWEQLMKMKKKKKKKKKKKDRRRVAVAVDQLVRDFQLTPGSGAIMRVMQYLATTRVNPRAAKPAKRADGQPALFTLAYNSNTNTAKSNQYGDGILFVLLRDGDPALRSQVVGVLRHCAVRELMDMLPRTAVWVLAEALPGNRLVDYAVRAASEASTTLSPFTIASLDAAIKKALNLALNEVDGYKQEALTAAGERKSRRGSLTGGSGSVPVWGPYEDEVLADLMVIGLYPLFLSSNMTTGEAAILRMSAQLLKFANHVTLTKRSLLAAHARQFPPQLPANADPAVAAAARMAADNVDVWTMDNIETLMLGTFQAACGKSQCRVVLERGGSNSGVGGGGEAGQQPGSRQEVGGVAATKGANGGSGGRDGGGGGAGANGMSTVVLVHTQDDLEYGMTYSRVFEVFPPATIARVALQHKSPFPDLTIRPMAETMFKFVRTLCHIQQKDLEWYRQPGGVRVAAVDGLFVPVVPGDSNWNVTDMLRPRNFGFRIAFAYTRRTITIELTALTLIRTVPVDVRRADGATGSGAATVGPAGGKAGGGGGRGGEGASLGRAHVGCAATDHDRADEFQSYWTRNPDVVRMDQVQSRAGRMEEVADLVGGNWRQMAPPPPAWITGWVDRFLRLMLLDALTQNQDGVKKMNLNTLYDTRVQGPWRTQRGTTGRVSSVAVPWTHLETNALVNLMSLHPLNRTNDYDEGGGKPRDMAGKLISEKGLERLNAVMSTKIASRMTAMVEMENPDRGSIVFATQWNKLAQQMNWPLRSPLEIRDAMDRLLRMSCYSYNTSWEASLQCMMGMLMDRDVSAVLRRETEAKLLSLASDSSFARRLVWGTCRGRQSEARCLALLSGVVEFQPLLLEALLEHEAESKAVAHWQESEQCWAVAASPALATLEPDRLAFLLQAEYGLGEPPLVVPYSALITSSAESQFLGGDPMAAGGTEGSNGSGLAGGEAVRGQRLMYCRFRNRAELAAAVASPLIVYANEDGAGDGDDAASTAPRGGVSTRGGLAASRRSLSPGAASVVALVPVSPWEAAALPAAQLPRRQDSQVMSFFSLVFSRLPRGLQKLDPHAAGTLWGGGVPAVLLHRRPASVRWAPWPSLPDVVEEAGVVGTLFEAHSIEPMPRAWLQELDASDNGVVQYREFLLAYLRHRAGDFLTQGPQPGAASAAVSRATSAGALAATGGQTQGPGAEEVPGPNPPPPATSASRAWQRATQAVQQAQVSQAFWDRANALRRLRHSTAGAAQQGRWKSVEGLSGGSKLKGGVASGAGARIAAVRQMGARALGSLATGGGPGGASSSEQLPAVMLAGLDSVASEELCEVQRAAWVAYSNLRSAARYLHVAQAEGHVAAAPLAGSASFSLSASLANAFVSSPFRLDAWQAAERAALESCMRGLKRPEALFRGAASGAAEGGGGNDGEGAAGRDGQSRATAGATSFSAAADGTAGGGSGPRSWLQAMAGAQPAKTQEAGPGTHCPHPRDVALLELILDLAATATGPAHGDLLIEGQEPLIGPMPGPSQLLMGRTVAAAAAQLGADAVRDVVSAVGALSLQTATEAAERDGLAPPLGGLDEVFLASALRLAAEEVWAFVVDMQALSDKVISPLVAAADQSVPIVQRESIKAMFGDTNIELMLEYEIELLKLLTVTWRNSTRTALVAPSVSGPAHYIIAAMQRRVAAGRVRAYRGEFVAPPEQLGVDPLSPGVQLRPVLTDTGFAEEVLTLLQRLATAYQGYLDKVDTALRELLACLERDEKGTFQALLRRFGRPRRIRKPSAGVPGAAGPAGGQQAPADGAGGPNGPNDQGGDNDASDDGAEWPEDEEGAPVGTVPADPDGYLQTPPTTIKDKGGRGVTVQLELRTHHVRPLLSVRQLARYGPGAEVEACLRKPAAHLATLAFLATICRSINTAQDKLPEVEAAAQGDGSESDTSSQPDTGRAAAPGATAGRKIVTLNVPQSDKGEPGAPSRAYRGLERSGSARSTAGSESGRAAATAGSLHNGSLRRAGVQAAGGGALGAMRRTCLRLLGVLPQMGKVLPLGSNGLALFEPGVAPSRPGAAPTSRAATVEHRVVLRRVGAVVLATEAAEGELIARLVTQRTLGERLDAWMEQRLLAGDWASRLLLVVCTALTCFTWRVVPLLGERRRYLEDLRVASNMSHHRQVIRELERAINVRPRDDDALDMELVELHRAIRVAIEDAEKEMDMGEGDASKMSPMSLEAEFWKTSGPKRVRDAEPLKAALRLAEHYTLHSTFGGARLLSNARRCAARMIAVDGAQGKGAKAKAGRNAAKPGAREAVGTYDSDSDEAEKILNAVAVPAKKGAAAAAAAGAKEKAKKGAGKDTEGGAAGGGSGGAVQLAKLFGGSRARAAAEGGPKPAWGEAGGGGMLAAVQAARNATKFAKALKRAVKRREHARRRWDKTLYLVTQSGEIDEAALIREHDRAVGQLRRNAALSAWKQLRGVADDMLTVFGAVVFRDVGRVFAIAMAMFLMFFPFVVLAVALKVQPDSASSRLMMGGLVGCYVLLGFVAMAAAVAQLRQDPSQLKVYRPSDTIRFPNFRKGTALASWKAHWVNVFALVTLVLEFWQLCAFSYQRRIPYPEASFLKRIFPWALLDLGPAAYFLQVFALLAFMIVWITVFFPQTPAGLKRVVVPFVGQAAYLTITSGLLSQLDCRLNSGLLVRNPDITCWTDPRHLYAAIAAMLALGLYVPRATLTPFEVFFPSENLDVKYRGLYVRVVQLLRLGMAGYNLFFAETYPLTVMAANAGVCALLAAMTAIMRPCCIGEVNIGRGTGFVLATWSQVVSVVALKLSPDTFVDPRSRQWYTDSWAYVYVLVGGWGVIAAVGLLLLRRYIRIRRSSALKFSLKRSPFNYTAPWQPPTEPPLAGAGGPAGDPGARQQPQLPTPPPPAMGAAPASAADSATPSGAGEGQGADARVSKSDGSPTGGGGDAGANGDGSQAQDNSSDEEEAEGGRGNSQRGGAKLKADGEAEAQTAAMAAALGIPLASARLTRDLAGQGLLTPADEMRSYMAKLVRQAERKLEGGDDGDDDSDEGSSDDKSDEKSSDDKSDEKSSDEEKEKEEEEEEEKKEEKGQEKGQEKDDDD